MQGMNLSACLSFFLELLTSTHLQQKFKGTSFTFLVGYNTKAASALFPPLNCIVLPVVYVSFHHKDFQGVEVNSNVTRNVVKIEYSRGSFPGQIYPTTQKNRREIEFQNCYWYYESFWLSIFFWMVRYLTETAVITNFDKI